VVDPGQVEELDRAAEALDPPAVPLGAVDGPVVERVAPELALRVERVGRRSGHLGEVEQPRMCGLVGGGARDVDRKVAHDPHAAVAA
jgi:hypothetical protein